ncbi:MAG: alginate lyase family protein [Clostridium sp.]
MLMIFNIKKEMIIIKKILVIAIIIILGLGVSNYYFFQKYHEYKKESIKTTQNNETDVSNVKKNGEGNFYNAQSIKNLSSDSKESIINSANKVLELKSLPTVTDKTNLIAKGETKNDYVSMAPYLWQNPNDANTYIVKDGVDNPERLNDSTYDSNRLNELVNDLNKVSFAYTITGDSKYADMANNLLNTWFINSETKMNPNMKYAEIFETKSGKTIYTGSSMISSVPLINLVNDIELLGNAVTNENSTGLKSWFNSFAGWLLNENGGNIDKLRINNHGTWLDADLATFYSYAGNSQMAEKILNTVGEYAINPQIQSSGKIPSALVRTKSLDYTEYNLEAFITLANLGDAYGINIWDYKSENDGSIEKAIEYVTNYLLGKTKWQYENIKGKDVNEESNKKFAMYLEIANKHYQNPEFTKVIEKYSKGNIGVNLV